VCGPCSFLSDADTEDLTALKFLHYSPIDVDGGVLSHLFPVAHKQLICIADAEREVVVLAPHWAPVLMNSMADMLLPTFTACGMPVRKSRNCQEVQHLAEGGVQSGPEIGDELGGDYGVECLAVVDDQHSYIVIPFVQVGKGSVESNRDCIICESVGAV
jgi:hypothetical protein